LGRKFPELVHAFSGLKVEQAAIDGEIAALDEKGRASFQLLQGGDMGERPPIVFYAFDLLWKNGKDLKGLPIEKRKAQLKEILTGHSGSLRYCENFDYDVAELTKKARALGLEGLVAKRKGSKYEPGKRSGLWVKLKFYLTGDRCCKSESQIERPSSRSASMGPVR
jgi:bifunctional non-homologous end joining protein LigD